MKKITLLLFLCCFIPFLGNAQSDCNYTLQMTDSFGDGWNGALLDVLVDGIVVLDDVALDDDPANDGSMGILTFMVSTGADVTTVFVDGGAFPGEIDYTIIDINGLTVGSGDATTDIGTGTITANCVPLSCFPVNNLMVTNITDVSADLSWEDNDNDPSAMSYDVEWGLAGFMPGSGTVEAAIPMTSFFLDGLDAVTSYDFYVTANCAVDDTSTIVGPFNFTTTVSCFAPTDLMAMNITETSADLSWIDPNDPLAMSYTLEWGLVGFMPGTGTIEADLMMPTFFLDGLDPNTGYDFYVTANCEMDDSSLVTGPMMFTTTPLIAPPGECEYTLQMLDSFGDGWNGALLDVFRNGEIVLDDVALNDDPANDGSIGSLPFEILPGDDVTTVLVDGGTFPGEISYNILDVSGNIVGSGDATTNIDSGTITADCPACILPSDLTADNITDVNADLSWTDINDPTAMSYDVEWGLAGFMPGSGTVEANLTMTNFFLDGLDPDTSYDFYVIANCDEDVISDIAGPFNFTTTISCFAPTDLMAMNITEMSADLSWIDPNDPLAMSYTLEWGLVGFMPGTGTIEADLMMPTFFLDGLDPNTGYDFYVTANCEMDDSSLVTGPMMFTTTPVIAPPGECEYTLQMLDSFGDGWNGASLDVFRNGEIVLDNVTLDDGSIGTLLFEVIPGDDVTTVFVNPGTFPGEISYNILDITGNIVGTGDVNTDIVSGTITAECESCDPPSNLEVTNLTVDGTVDISWDASTDNVSFNWEIQLQGIPPGDPGALAVGIGTTDTFDTVTGLFEENVTYTLYVQSVCESGAISDFVSIDFIFDVLDTADNAIDGFQFFPNPIQDNLNLTASTELQQMIIYNMVGQVVLDREIRALNVQTDVSNLTAGVYLMQVVSTNGQTGTYRLIKK